MTRIVFVSYIIPYRLAISFSSICPSRNIQTFQIAFLSEERLALPCCGTNHIRTWSDPRWFPTRGDTLYTWTKALDPPINGTGWWYRSIVLGATNPRSTFELTRQKFSRLDCWYLVPSPARRVVYDEITQTINDRYNKDTQGSLEGLIMVSLEGFEPTAILVSKTSAYTYSATKTNFWHIKTLAFS